MDYKIVRNFLSDDTINHLKSTNKSFKAVPVGKGHFVHAFELSDIHKAELLEEMEAAVGKDLVLIEAFIRFNDSETNTEFRVHADGVISGLKTDYACVVYLTDDPETCTALMWHPKHGKLWTSGENVHVDDDGKWKVYKTSGGAELNKAFIYKANLWHTRWPSASKNVREVIVGFFGVKR